MEQSLKEIYKDVLEEAQKYENRCLEGKRWDGNAILIVVDTALTSIGVNYFNVVIPSVKKFYDKYVQTGEIDSFEDFSKLTADDNRLRNIINSQRSWNTAIELCRVLNQIRRENDLKSDFAALKFWAEKANYEKWNHDIIGKIHGVGLTTFQYLRLQAGIDTVVPDRMIRKEAEKKFAIKTKKQIEFIKKMEEFLSETNFSPTLFCWVVWLGKSR